ncbi:MAG TPA: molybdenum cofactor biosynthesis protein MoaE [Verrucomicrobiae bacterium]|nr:molybdenum cofactor biosynthesis protein MoaE [Verrucomicrobiae bacterium]
MKVTVQFFSFLRQLVGCNELQLDMPATATVADLLAELHQRFPRLSAADKTTLIAVGVEFAKREDKLKDGVVVSLMPPLQGGVDDELIITDKPIDAAEATLGKFSGDVGGVVTFWGVVRDREDGKPITALEYTAYREMAEHQFRKILDETHRRWPLKRIRLIHRLGVVAVGEASLLVRVEAAHRGEAFAAAQFIIDELKQKVPIWKAAVPRKQGT